MRDAAAWSLLFFLLLAALPSKSACAQDMLPQEEEMEELGSPPAGVPPESAGIPAPDPVDPPAATPDPDLLANAQLLDTLLIRATTEQVREQKFAAAAGIMGGVILLGIGGWRLIENTPQDDFTRGLGIMFMTLGAADLTTGIFAATRISHEKRRLARWEKLKDGGIGELELARIEGELQASAETRNGERLLVRWNGLTHAIAGAIVMGTAPIPDASNARDRRTAYIVGGIFIGTGVAAMVLSYRPTPTEKAWKEYQAKKARSKASKFNIRIAPAMWRGGGGVSAGGTF
ncbi:MAG: hypothetical protein AAF436_10585 [Myxococcota bacterium]